MYTAPMYLSARLPVSLALILTVTALAPGCGDSGGAGDGESNDDFVGDSSSDSVGTQDESGSAESESAEGTGDGTDTEIGEEAETGDETASDTDAGSESESESESETQGESSNTSDMACEEFNSDVAPIPPDVLFLLDRSGSMMETGFDLDDEDKTRWQSLYEAVEAVVDDGADTTISFGAKTFSTAGFGGCGVSGAPDVPLALNNASTLLDDIPGPLTVVNGGTPTNLALVNTMGYMQGYETDGDKIVILLTDGRIGCANSDAEAIADAVEVLETALADDEITTYVVGIAPSIFGPITDQLNAMAVAGGAPSDEFGQDYYKADDADMLAAALEQVVEDSYGKSCLLDLDEPPFFPEFTKVVIGGNIYDLIEDCENEDGFIYSGDPEYSQITMCGQGCVDLGDVQNAEVQYFCNPG